MKNKKSQGIKGLCAGLAVWGLLSLPAGAAVLMLDFGPTTVTGTDRTNSAYHTANVSFVDTSWNQVQIADIGSGLLWSDGTSATGLSLNLGASTAGPSTPSSPVLLTSNPSGNSALGGSVNTGIYAGNSVGKDGIFSGSGGQARSVGFQLSGLAAGTYDIYVAARGTSASAGSQTQTVYAGVSSTSGNFVPNGAGMTAEALTYASNTAATSAWVEDANYVKYTLTLGTGDYLNLSVLGGGTEVRGMLNAVQIVAVPEPSTGLLVLSGLAGLWFLRRKQRAA